MFSYWEILANLAAIRVHYSAFVQAIDAINMKSMSMPEDGIPCASIAVNPRRRSVAFVFAFALAIELACFQVNYRSDQKDMTKGQKDNGHSSEECLLAGLGRFGAALVSFLVRSH